MFSNASRVLSQCHEYTAHASWSNFKSACEKDLGVLVNGKLSWHDHIVNKVNKAHKVLRLIRKLVESTLTLMLSRSFILILLDLVWTMLHWQVWSPHQAYLRNMIEGVQRRATKLMVGSKLSYSDRLLKTGPMSLSSRKIYLDLLFLFKCQHGQYDLDVSGYLQFY